MKIYTMVVPLLLLLTLQGIASAKMTAADLKVPVPSGSPTSKSP